MTKLQIFSDFNCRKEVGYVLYEGDKYYLKFPTSEVFLIELEIENSGLKEFIEWHPLNTIASLRVLNHIGLVRFFGEKIDIRSKKLLESETGDRQFKIILDDLASMSRHILFGNAAAPSVYRSHKNNSHNASLLEKFNYYRQTCLSVGKRIGLEKLVEAVLRNPHSRLINESVWDHIWKVRNPTYKTLKSLVRHDQEFISIPDSNPLAKNFSSLISKGNDYSIFPMKALRSKGRITYDTPENRFIKFFLNDVELVCMKVKKNKMVSGSLLKQCDNLLKLSRSLLKKDFFIDIGKAQAIPSSSPTLTQRHGYREIYSIFSRSRMGVKHIFDDMLEESLFIELKNIAVLYEYWVFYKICTTLLKKKSTLLNLDTIVKNGRIEQSVEVTDGFFTIYFNKTFSRSSKRPNSFSLSLRPDIVIEHTPYEGSPVSIYILDAKYKSIGKKKAEDHLNDEDALLQETRVVNPADLHKMHCYADAIEGVVSAVAVYPGTKFIFFSRNRCLEPIKAPQSFLNLEGVGAVPLLPGKNHSDFIEFLKT